MLTFNKQTHTYYWDDKTVPSVTQIIHEWMEINVYGIKYYTNRYTGTTINADTFRQAGDFGSAVHTGVKILAEGRKLDFNTMHSSLNRPLSEFLRWQGDYNPDIVLVEQALYSKKYCYAGTPDLIAIINRRLSVIDIKTGGFSMAGVQTSGYEQLYREHTKKNMLHMPRYILHLPKDGGDYQFIKQNNESDFDCYLALLRAHQHMKGRL